MRALSIQQPWAWLIVNGFKEIENRCWRTFVRGEILIHAGKKFDRDGYEFVMAHFPHIQMPAPKEFPVGGVVGKAVLSGCVSASSSPWFFGPFGLILKDAQPLPFQACRGQLGFFMVDGIELENGNG